MLVKDIYICVCVCRSEIPKSKPKQLNSGFKNQVHPEVGKYLQK